MLRVMITGDMGFVGDATKRTMGWNPDNDYDCFADKFGIVGFDAMRGEDIRDLVTLRDHVKGARPDRILHLAAIARFSDADADPILAHETNVIGTKNVMEVASEFRIPVVYASTGSVYMPIKEKPPITEIFRACGNSVYGCTKYMGEIYVMRSSVPWIILRYAHLYGKEKRMHGLIGGFADRIKRGLAPTLYGGKQSNDFTYIKDVAEANVAALKAPWDKWRQAYNIGTGEELSAEDAGKIICKSFGYDGQIDIREQRTVDPDRFVFDCTKAEVMLGFKAKYTFEKGLEDMQREIGREHEDLASRTLRAA